MGGGWGVGQGVFVCGGVGPGQLGGEVLLLPGCSRSGSGVGVVVKW